MSQNRTPPDILKSSAQYERRNIGPEQAKMTVTVGISPRIPGDCCSNLGIRHTQRSFENGDTEDTRSAQELHAECSHVLIGRHLALPGSRGGADLHIPMSTTAHVSPHSHTSVINRPPYTHLEDDGIIGYD